MEPQKYDLIASLGGNCAAAAQLRMRGLRPFALPFDWLLMEDVRTMEYLPKGFSNGFSDFCLKENLLLLKEDYGTGTAKFKYRDRLTGWCFLHHFHDDINCTDAYEKTAERLRRAIGRFFDAIRKSKNVLFVLSTAFPYDLAIAEDMASSIRSQFPDKNIDFHLVQFNAKFENPETLGERIKSPYCTGEKWARNVNWGYELDKTSYEWQFLDDLELVSFPRKQIAGMDKIRYKIWKHLSNRLMERRLRCKGIQF